jgi:F0F1-type ATP synthase membrane subunit c/vacuolar-type H+-ATPase subunit K
VLAMMLQLLTAIVSGGCQKNIFTTTLGELFKSPLLTKLHLLLLVLANCTIIITVHSATTMNDLLLT